MTHDRSPTRAERMAQLRREIARCRRELAGVAGRNPRLMDAERAARAEELRRELKRLGGQLGGLRTFEQHGRTHMVNAGIRGFDARARRHFGGDHKALVNWLINRGLQAYDPVPQNGAWTRAELVPDRVPRWRWAGPPEQRQGPAAIRLEPFTPQGDVRDDLPW